MKLKTIIPIALLGSLFFSCLEEAQEDVLPVVEDVIKEKVLAVGATSYIDLSQGINETGATSVVITKNPSKGTASIFQEKWVKYVPDTSFVSGSDDLEIDYLDQANESLKKETYSMSVSQDSTYNDCFTGAYEDYFEFRCSTSLVATVLENDAICNEYVSSVVITIIEEPTDLDAIIDEQNNIIITNDNGFSGVNFLTYSLLITDNEGTQYSSEADVTIYADGIELKNDNFDSPSLSGDKYLLEIFDNDVYCELDLETLEFTAPANGVISTEATGDWIAIYYTPNEGYFGDDTFTYSICDAAIGSCGQATVTLSIPATTDCPDFNLVADEIELLLSSLGDLKSFQLDIYANDVICNADISTVTFPVGATSGRVSLERNTEVHYTPNDGFVGEDSFEYTLCEYGNTQNCKTVKVNLTVK